MIRIALRVLLASTPLLVFAPGISTAQNSSSALARQFSRIDLGITGAGQITGTVSGRVLPTGASNCYAPNVINPSGPCTTVLSQTASTTVGALANIRYVAKPYFGLEFNYGFARYTEGYTPSPDPATSIFQIQTTANEYSFGYIITPHQIFGLQPFLSAGAGTTEFKPTGGGGEGEPKQARATYYYNVGLQQDLFQSNFGLRVSLRQVFFMAPDYGQNYLTILKHTSTIQPNAGFYLRF